MRLMLLNFVVNAIYCYGKIRLSTTSTTNTDNEMSTASLIECLSPELYISHDVYGRLRSNSGAAPRLWLTDIVTKRQLGFQF